MEAFPPKMFSPLAPGHSVATLILVENSEEMMLCWQDLRHRYLPNLLGTMRRANPHVPIQILWMTSCPVPLEDQLSSSLNRSRQYNQLPELRPIAHPRSRISLGTMYRALELLSSTFKDAPTTRHLIVVSASTPTDDLGGTSSITSTTDSHSPWDYLSMMVFRKGIYLHMVLAPAPGHDMDKFVRLHADTAQMQACCNVNPWFQADLDKYFFFLSCPVNSIPLTQQGESVDVDQVSLYTPGNNSDPHSSLSYPLRASFPGSKESTPVGPGQCVSICPAIQSRCKADTQRPSLVEHLQKVHGLVKRRTYSLQPSRTPFVRDDNGETSYDHALDSISNAADPQTICGDTVQAQLIPTRTTVPRHPRHGNAPLTTKQKVLGKPRHPNTRSPCIASTHSHSPKIASSRTAVSPLATLAPVCEADMPVTALADHTKGEPDVAYPSPSLPESAIGQLWMRDASSTLAQLQAQTAHGIKSAAERPMIPMRQNTMDPLQMPLPGPDFQEPYVSYPVLAGPPPPVSVPEHGAPPPSSSALASCDGDRPFIFYPEYEQATVILIPDASAPSAMGYHTEHSTSSQPRSMDNGMDYSYLLNPAVSPGMLRSSSLANDPTPVSKATHVYHAVQQSSVGRVADGHSRVPDLTQTFHS